MHNINHPSMQLVHTEVDSEDGSRTSVYRGQLPLTTSDGRTVTASQIQVVTNIYDPDAGEDDPENVYSEVSVTHNGGDEVMFDQGFADSVSEFLGTDLDWEESGKQSSEEAVFGDNF